MKSNIILAITLALSLSACKPQIIKVPVYQEVVVQHPTETPPPALTNPPIRAVGARDIAAEASRPENVDKIYYVLNQETLNAWLLDEVAKLEYAQSETRRANFYRDVIEQFNKRVREINKNVAK